VSHLTTGHDVVLMVVLVDPDQARRHYSMPSRIDLVDYQLKMEK